jgi:multidrug resistance efflux pump
MQPIVANPTTTIRRYSIVVEADTRRQAALQAWKAAAEALLNDRKTYTEAQLHQAAAALKQANLDYYSVTKKVFPKTSA